ncbi:MAG TPA: N-acetylmuramoyl-L-alanine amidase [Chloroflexia bacterium]|nr:N-acetylmuramoyl-L-alanine amidase [Chloroflexia bacterium]
MPKARPLADVLTLEELAAYLQLPVAVVVAQAASGALPGRQIAGNWRFLKAAVDEWLRGDAPALAPTRPPRTPRRPRHPAPSPPPSDGTRDLGLPGIEDRGLAIPFVGCAGPNFEKGRRGQPIVAVVNHVMIGTMAGTKGVFDDDKLKDPVSANYGISQTGEIVQYVHDEDTAFANGPLRNPNSGVATWLQQPFTGSQTPNHRSISIEWEGRHRGGQSGKRPWTNPHTGITEQIAVDFMPGTITSFWQPTDAQYQAGLTLIRELCARHNVPLDRAHICRHSDTDSVKKWFCPGEGFPMQRLLDDLNGDSHPPADSPSTDFPVLAAPSMSQAAFTLALSAAHSPTLDEADAAAYYGICQSNGIDPTVALALFAQETNFGTQDGAGDHKNWANLWDHAAGALGVYPSWQQGLVDFCRTMQMPPYTDGGPPTIARMVPIHRGTDRTDNDEYIAQVRDRIKQMQGT